MNLKLVVIGNGSVGKTSLLIVFTNGNFPFEYVPTVFDNYTKEMKIKDNNNNDQSILLDLFDTAGGEDYPRLRPLSYPLTDVFLICFSVVDRKSFENVETYWYPEIQLFCPKVPIILVGTKSDLYDKYEKSDYVKYEEGLKMANKIQAVHYFETSSLKNKNISKLFESIAIIAYNYNKSKLKKNNFQFPEGFNVEASRFVFNAPGDSSDDSSSSSSSSDENNIGSKKCIIN